MKGLYLFENVRSRLKENLPNVENVLWDGSSDSKRHLIINAKGKAIHRINQPVCMQRVIRLLTGIFSFAYKETKGLLISKRKDAYKQTN